MAIASVNESVCFLSRRHKEKMHTAMTGLYLGPTGKLFGALSFGVQQYLNSILPLNIYQSDNEIWEIDQN
jgi:hypothetical protein